MAAFDFHEHEGELRLTYEPDEDRGVAYWVYKKLQQWQTANVRRVLFFNQSHLTSRLPKEEELSADAEPPPNPTFRLGKRRGNYFLIDRDILRLNVDLLIHKDLDLTIKTFVAEGNISIFKRIEETRPRRIVVGGDEEDSIPISEFNLLIAKFPTHTELRKYALARVSSVVREYLQTDIDGQAELERHLAKRNIQKVNDIHSKYAKFDAAKYRELHTRLSAILGESESISEKTWQMEIVQIICLLNPRYIRAFPEAPVTDSYRNKERRIDFLLVDASGHVDIAEIKKPTDAAIVSATSYARNNFIPMRELSGAVMQVEKYLFHLSKSGKAGEDRLTTRYKLKLPTDFRIKITNPAGIIIMGRDHNLTDEQRHDFEVMRRQYRSVIDVITYDDLLRRLDFVVKILEDDDDAL
jgi:hypothetical protein